MKKTVLSLYASKGTRDKAYMELEKSINSIADDKTLNWFIKTMRNKIVADLERSHEEEIIFSLQQLINRASDKLDNLTDTANLLMENGQPVDLLLLIEMLDRRLSKVGIDAKSLAPIIKKMLSEGSSKDIIQKQLLINDIKIDRFMVSNQLDKLIKIIISTNDATMSDIIKGILYSPRINELDIETIKNAITFLASTKTLNYNDILNELILRHITNKTILLGFKDAIISGKNDELTTKVTISAICKELYVGSGFGDKKYIVNNAADILKKYDDKMLNAFVDSLDSSFVHKKTWQGQQDLVTIFLTLNKNELAMQIFGKSCYKPINKSKRNQELDRHIGHNSSIDSKFSDRLDNIISCCLKLAKYDILFEILSSKKVDSISINNIYHILVAINKKATGEVFNNYSQKYCNDELREKILEVIREKINNGQLIVYKTSNGYGELFFTEPYIFDKNRVLDYIDFVNANSYMDYGNIKEEFTKRKIPPKASSSTN